MTLWITLLLLLLGVAIVCLTAADVISTLVVTSVGTGIWRPARVVYRYTWRTWRAIGRRFAAGPPREQWLSAFGPLSVLLVLLVWLVVFMVGWALIYSALLPQFHDGASDVTSLLYFSGSTLLAPSFGALSASQAGPGLLTLLETLMGYGTVALLISYLPALYAAFNRREVRLLMLDDSSDERLTPLSVIRTYAPNGDLEHLYAFLAGWEMWTAEILETHVSYPMLAYFRSQHAGKSWIAALGLVMDTAALLCATVPGAEGREPFFTYRRGVQVVGAMARRLHTGPGDAEPLLRGTFVTTYEGMRACGLPLRECDTAWERVSALHETYAATLQGLFDYLLAQRGFSVQSDPL